MGCPMSPSSLVSAEPERMGLKAVWADGVVMHSSTWVMELRRNAAQARQLLLPHQGTAQPWAFACTLACTRVCVYGQVKEIPGRPRGSLACSR